MTKVANREPNKFEKRIADKVPVENPVDPWTVQQKDMPLPVAEAVAAINDNVTPEEVPMCKKHGTPFTKKDDSGRMRCERCKQGRQKPKSTWCIRHNMEKVAQVGNAALLCKSCRSEAAARRYQNRKVQDV